MDFALSGEQQLIRQEIQSLCTSFGDSYWRMKDQHHEYPQEFFNEFAANGWCGLTVPTEYGGEGYGVQEAALVQQEIARSGAAMAGTSVTSHHVFSTAPLVEYGSDAHRQRYLPQIARGEVQVCTGVTEPNAGLDTSRIETTATREGESYAINGQKVWTSKAQHADLIMLLARTGAREETDRFGGLSLFFTEFNPDDPAIRVSEIPKAGRGASASNEVWFDNFTVPVDDRIGYAGSGFRYLLSFANAKRIALAASSIGTGQRAIQKAAAYATERVVFDNPIGSYQAIQHPLADSWSKLEQAELMLRKAAWCYDNGDNCGAEANAVKLRASEDALEACERAIRVHGGMGYAKEYDVERYWKEMLINVLAPVSNEMVKNYLAQHELGLPRSY